MWIWGERVDWQDRYVGGSQRLGMWCATCRFDVSKYVVGCRCGRVSVRDLEWTMEGAGSVLCA